MLEVRKALFAYNEGTALFSHLNFTVEKGTTMSILGPNGAGKTTLLKCILGFLNLQKGNILLDKVNRSKIGRKDFWSKISYIPQARSASFSYSVRDMVLMGRASSIGIVRAPGKEDLLKADEMIELTGLKDLADKPINRISGGELQLTLIARGLAKDPELIVLDEPESNLDMKNQLMILELLEKLKRDREITNLINTHYPDHALRIAEKALLLGKNCNYLTGNTRDVITTETIKEFFGVESQLVELQTTTRIHKKIFPIGLINQ